MSDHNFNTPPDILAKVRLLDPKRGIGLDPCSNPASRVGAVTSWSAGMVPDSLTRSWRGYGLVFMNPPHSMSPHNIEPWMEKAFLEFPGQCAPWGRDQFVGLVLAKTDTKWFQEVVLEFPVRCFLRGRPKFWLNGAPMPGPGKFASMLIYAGAQSGLFREIFGADGWVI